MAKKEILSVLYAKELASEIPEANMRISATRVPHVVVKLKKMTYSICYFGKIGKLRVFNNYGNFTTQQKRKDFNTLNEVIEFFNELRVQNNNAK